MTQSNSVILYKQNRAKNQKWYLSYHANKNSYKIYSKSSGGIVLALDFPSLNIISESNGDSDNQYWIINYQPDSKLFTIFNYNNPNLFLSIDSDKKLVVDTKITSNNNKFIKE
ncbi:RICIN domain-containing protein [Clostridium cuniculi]|uniref:RICIN domain-containing protein n=1 Tax=Clostridium cuniculi TaxID=2548455 RepID=UPI0010566135|nr:RICIN domain-containing protein [Clostridium cuniculi]